jgi:hypothetical protein
VATRAPGARQRNFELLRTNMNTGDQLFDQVLVSPALAVAYVRGSARVFDHPVAVRGNDRDRASDHLPVYADFELGGLTAGPAPAPATSGSQPPAPPAAPARLGVGGAGLRIAGLLPDPEGEDGGREQVVLENGAGAAVPLRGWRLRDRSGNEYALAGEVGAREEFVLTLPAGALPLNNAGDELALISPDGAERQRVRYRAGQVKAGRLIRFP